MLPDSLFSLSCVITQLVCTEIISLSVSNQVFFPLSFFLYTNDGTSSVNNPARICLCLEFEKFQADVNYLPLEHSFRKSII